MTSHPVDELTEDQIAQVLALFDAAYADAGHPYLLSSFEVMGWFALATSGNDTVTLAGIKHQPNGIQHGFVWADLGNR